MKKIYFSRHAKNRMRWRKITEDEVNEVISSPEEIADSFGNRKVAYRHIAGKYLKVIFVEQIDKIIIVTVIDKTR